MTEQELLNFATWLFERYVGYTPTDRQVKLALQDWRKLDECRASQN